MIKNRLGSHGLWLILAVGLVVLCTCKPVQADVTFGTSAMPAVATPWQNTTFSVSADPTGSDVLQHQCQLTSQTWTWTVSGDAGCTVSVDPSTTTVDSTTVTFNSAIAGKHTIVIGCTIVTVSSCGTDTVSDSTTATLVVANVSLTARRSGTTTWGGNANVAAGGIATPEHKADVMVTLTDDAGIPVSGVPVKAPSISDASGVWTPATISPATATTDGGGNTFFTFASSDIGRTITLSLGNGSAAVEQHWDEICDGSDWSYNPYFYYGSSSGITFMPSFFDGDQAVRITSHNIDFVVLNLDVWEWNDDLGCYLLTYKEAPDPSLATFIPATASDSGGGSYASGLMVNYNPSRVVDTAYFEVEDDNAWKP